MTDPAVPCPRCQGAFENGFCSRCGFPAAWVDLATTAPGAPAAGASNDLAWQPGEAGVSCPSCTMLNPRARKLCAYCHAPLGAVTTTGRKIRTTKVKRPEYPAVQPVAVVMVVPPPPPRSRGPFPWPPFG